MRGRVALALLACALFTGTETPADVVTVAATRGPVEVRRGQDERHVAARPGMDLGEGFDVRTGDAGQAKIRIDTRAVAVLGPRGRLVGRAGAGVPASLRLESGDLKVVCDAGEAPGMSIETFGVVTEVRGIGVLRVPPDAVATTLVGVSSGSASVRASASRMPAVVAAPRAVEVRAGEVRERGTVDVAMADALGHTEMLDGGHDPDDALDAGFDADGLLLPSPRARTLGEQTRAPLADGGAAFEERAPAGQSDHPCLAEPRPPQCPDPPFRRGLRRMDRRSRRR